MRYPINGDIVITTKFGATPDTGVFGRHAGLDLKAPLNTAVFAPIAGTVTASYKGDTGNIVEITADGKSHRLLHMNSRLALLGTKVFEGQKVGLSGKYGTGPHVHWDIRKAGTAWNHSFNDYFNPEELIGGEVSKPTYTDVLNAFNKYGIGVLTEKQQNYYVANDVAVLWKDLLDFQTDRLREAKNSVTKQAVVDYIGKNLK